MREKSHHRPLSPVSLTNGITCLFFIVHSMQACLPHLKVEECFPLPNLQMEKDLFKVWVLIYVGIYQRTYEWKLMWLCWLRESSKNMQFSHAEGFIHSQCILQWSPVCIRCSHVCLCYVALWFYSLELALWIPSFSWTSMECNCSFRPNERKFFCLLLLYCIC